MTPYTEQKITRTQLLPNLKATVRVFTHLIKAMCEHNKALSKFNSFNAMDKSPFEPQRKSHIEQGEIYFWTATINKWQRLLENDEYKNVIIQSLQWLTDTGKVDVFAFIIMPNHIHLIWRVNEPNGKESPQGSFLKHTAHTFKKMLQKEDSNKLDAFKVEAANKKYEFWQRDSLAIPIFTREVAMQKLKYLHNNPLKEHWELADDPCNYKFSSARYYELNEKNFPFLKDLWEAV